MDEKLEILMCRNVMASQAGAGHQNELPGIPDGLKLPAETVKESHQREWWFLVMNESGKNWSVAYFIASSFCESVVLMISFCR